MSVTISLAQIPVVRGNWRENLKQHLKMIEQSSKYNADVVVFPELSLTGYELDLAEELALSLEPSNFEELSRASVQSETIIVAGCPLRVPDLSHPTIGAVVCFPDGRVEFYSKQHLHDGEGNYCSAGDVDYIFDVNGHKIALAICADFIEADHSQRAKHLGADIYLASALISENGFDPDSKILAGIASEHGIPVLLSNHISLTGGWGTCGKSSVWNSQGERVISAKSKESGIVLCTISGCETDLNIAGKWHAESN
ncbi:MULTISPECIES: carbon-nitrogen hydrolase family protein [Vibrio]|uniref:carbon-nitrogen hydrolase family protein n=1 Tax=Vibrio TaxID=662 RepID=UPI000C82D496|nr:MULTISPECIES: carbon-nitrogen hydrolase family protein [unclassified Vibrio]PMI25108.1 amidohydrolase [Vibrio sp. 10N.286.46.E10]PMJ03188.1 amidohydrolase [Vibrio sp. 10N.286.45.E10]PTO96000.1 carbon-nitrogen hydrolase family protein [Vibrio sp. 10N.286.48.B8]PTP11267.1 carbon-nitrogen hydrolase family protein [Vibrio sp. 10N.286.45.A3]PTQ21027.1 carbon-nitrogen hydrolase family protein [Vibrio sp. 10N.286.46.E10]